MLDAGCWMLDAGQIVDDLAPISRLEGDIFYRGCWIRNSRHERQKSNIQYQKSNLDNLSLATTQRRNEGEDKITSRRCGMLF